MRIKKISRIKKFKDEPIVRVIYINFWGVYKERDAVRGKGNDKLNQVWFWCINGKSVGVSRTLTVFIESGEQEYFIE